MNTEKNGGLLRPVLKAPLKAAALLSFARVRKELYSGTWHLRKWRATSCERRRRIGRRVLAVEEALIQEVSG